MCASLHRRGAPTCGPPGEEEIDGGGGPRGGVLHIGGMATRRECYKLVQYVAIANVDI
jgi:hypothetical protein